MGHRRKGFTLTELLTGMIIQAGFILVLCGAFYMLLSFGTRTQQILTARERGQRVIAFVGNRIANAGLGFHDLTKVKDVQKALSPFIGNSNDKQPLYNSRSIGLHLPVAISYGTTDTSMNITWPKLYESKEKNCMNFANSYKVENADGRADVWHGNILTLLYAQREDDKDKNLVIIHTGEADTSDPAKYEPIYQLMNNNQFTQANTGFTLDNKKNIENWAVTATFGKPLVIQTVNVGSKQAAKITTYASSTETYVSDNEIIASGDELLRLKCARMFVNQDSNGNMNFVFQELIRKGKSNASEWSDLYPHEAGILGMYMEMDKDNNILNLWVLATGGKDNKRHPRPSDWPEKAQPNQSQWSNYQYEVTYVSRASWKLHNIPDGFKWTN